MKTLTYIFIFWFFFNPYRALSYLASCWLIETDTCVECRTVDLNNDGVVNMIDYAILVTD